MQLRLSVQRLRTSQEKKSAQAKVSRRDIATLLEKGKVETARIKVENIIHEDIQLELLELLELYCELLIARFGLLDQNTRDPDPAVSEGVCSIIHAAPRTEIKELHILRDLLMHKYGREFSVAVMENRDGCVSERVMKKLTIDMPSSELVDAYLTEIAKGYGVNWAPLVTPGKTDDDDEGGGVKEATAEKQAVPVVSASAAFAEGKGDKPPKLPDLPPTEDDDAKGAVSANNKQDVRSPPAPPREDDFEMLAKRFEALKKR